VVFTKHHDNIPDYRALSHGLHIVEEQSSGWVIPWLSGRKILLYNISAAYGFVLSEGSYCSGGIVLSRDCFTKGSFYQEMVS